MLTRTTVTKIPTPTASWKELIKVFLFHVKKKLLLLKAMKISLSEGKFDSFERGWQEFTLVRSRRPCDFFFCLILYSFWFSRQAPTKGKGEGI